MLIVVDLPAPFGPRKPNTSRVATSKLIPRTARTSPNVLTRSVTEMAEVATGAWVGVPSASVIAIAVCNLALAGGVFAGPAWRRPSGVGAAGDIGRSRVLVGSLGVVGVVIGILGEDPIQAAPGLVEQLQRACALCSEPTEATCQTALPIPITSGPSSAMACSERPSLGIHGSGSSARVSRCSRPASVISNTREPSASADRISASSSSCESVGYIEPGLGRHSPPDRSSIVCISW